MESKDRIEKLVYDFTFFPSGNYRHYLPIVDLFDLFDQIIKTNEAAMYIKVIPFFQTADWQHEFDNYMLFCKKLENGESEKKFMQECTVDEYGNPRRGIIRCYKNDDIESFQNAIIDYRSRMNTIVKEIYEFLGKQCEVKNEEILLGSLCFEVNAK